MNRAPARWGRASRDTPPPVSDLDKYRAWLVGAQVRMLRTETVDELAHRHRLEPRLVETMLNAALERRKGE